MCQDTCVYGASLTYYKLNGENYCDTSCHEMKGFWSSIITTDFYNTKGVCKTSCSSTNVLYSKDSEIYCDN